MLQCKINVFLISLIFFYCYILIFYFFYVGLNLDTDMNFYKIPTQMLGFN